MFLFLHEFSKITGLNPKLRSYRSSEQVNQGGLVGAWCYLKKKKALKTRRTEETTPSTDCQLILKNNKYILVLENERKKTVNLTTKAAHPRVTQAALGCLFHFSSWSCRTISAFHVIFSFNIAEWILYLFFYLWTDKNKKRIGSCFRNNVNGGASLYFCFLDLEQRLR